MQDENAPLDNAPSDNAPLPLAGVKILDFSWALVGSLTTKLLADHGAEVVKVESSLRPCLSRIDNQVSASTRGNFDDKPWFSHFNSSKLSLQLNIKHPRVREVINPLLDWADVVVENFSPGTMEKLGLDYKTISQQRPDIIMVSGSVFGQTGPYAKNWGVDGTGAALSGRMYMTGWADRDPVTPSVPYGDVVLPHFMAAAVSAALDYKRRSGKGQYIDASMYEVCAQQMADACLEAQQQDSPSVRRGNRSPDVLFQAVLPCQGENLADKTQQRWIGISVTNEEEWQSLTSLLSSSELSSSELPGTEWPDAKIVRALNERELEKLEVRIAEWTKNQGDYQLMETLQKNNIAAGVVQDIADTFQRDPQLQHRQYLKELEHSILGSFGHQTPPFSLSRTPAQVKLAPNLGEHSQYVCEKIIGLSEEEFSDLSRAELFV